MKPDSNTSIEEFPPIATQTDALPQKPTSSKDTSVGLSNTDKPVNNSGTPELSFAVTFNKGLGSGLASIGKVKEESKQKSPEKAQTSQTPMFAANPFSKTELFGANLFANSELGASLSGL